MKYFPSTKRTNFYLKLSKFQDQRCQINLQVSTRAARTPARETPAVRFTLYPWRHIWQNCVVKYVIFKTDTREMCILKLSIVFVETNLPARSIHVRQRALRSRLLGIRVRASFLIFVLLDFQNFAFLHFRIFAFASSYFGHFCFFVVSWGYSWESLTALKLHTFDLFLFFQIFHLEIPIFWSNSIFLFLSSSSKHKLFSL